MKRLFGTLLILLCGIIVSSQGKTAEVTIILEDQNAVVLKKHSVQILSQTGEKIASGFTDTIGEYIISLPQEQEFEVRTVLEGRTMSGFFTIPTEYNYFTFRFVLSRPERFGTSSGSEDSEVKIQLVDALKIPIPDHGFSLFSSSGQLMKKAYTDGMGFYTIILKKGETYKLSTHYQDADFTIPLEVPEDIDVYHFVYMVGNEKAVYDTVYVPYQAAGKAILNIRITDEDGIPEGEAKLKLLSGNKVLSNGLTNGDGRFTAEVEQHAHLRLLVEKMGRTFDATIKLPKEKEVAEYNYELMIKVVEEYVRTYELENVYFDYNKSTLRPESYQALDALYAVLRDNPEMKIEIAGHTDSDGEEEYNQQLSYNRAKAVMQYLVDKGVGSFRLIAKGYGETQPVVHNNSPENKQLNRRTEIRVITE